MSYDIGRANLIRRAYAGNIKTFVENYTKKKKTIVLLPGGMGSQLDRSPVPYDGSRIPFSDFETVWMDIGAVFDRDTLKLEIDDQGRDIDGHIIVPNGPLRFAVLSYDGTEQYFKDNDYNYIVFGYDWRRPLEECAGFLEDFLTQLRIRVFKRHREDPLPLTTLLCHSQGGLVAKVFLHNIFDAESWFDKIITVGTPFYGTWSHQKRYFIGQKPLNTLHGKSRIAKLVSTMPGPYILMFLDGKIFKRDHKRLGLEADEYPIKDYETGEPADPYNQLDLKKRYPEWINENHLERARRIRETIAAPLPKSMQNRFYNLRSCKKKTPTHLIWKTLKEDFDPDDKDTCPVEVDSFEGGGDGTVPFWSAWHAYTDEENRVELKKANDHIYLPEHSEVLKIVTNIIEKDRPPVKVTKADDLYGLPKSPAPINKVQRFFSDVTNQRASRDDKRAYDKSIWQGIYEEIMK